MTRKEQETNAVKGFKAKWSREVYTVVAKRKLRKNQFMFRYDIGKVDTFYRHELLKIFGQIDDIVPQQYVRYDEKIIGGDYNPDSDYMPSDEEWEHD